MSNIYVVEVESEPTYSIDVESGAIAGLSNIYLEVVNTEKILVSDLPNYNVAYTGTISVDQIIGLDTYISGFIDTYEIDCGTPFNPT